jgi:hypothetical protein
MKEGVLMSNKPPQDEYVFEGFEQSNTTPVPDIFFDKLLSKLSGAEIKVLLYIIRRTAGFKKTTDAISLSQFEKGITTRDGKQLDHGCGIKRRQTIVDALVSLEKKGCIVSSKEKTSEGDNATTVYQIHFKGVVSKPDYPSSSEGSFKTVPPSFNSGLGVVAETGLPVVSKPDPQETVLQQTEGTYGNDNSETPNNSLSSTPSLTSLSLENASLQDLYARINQLEQQGPELERLSTPSSTSVSNGETSESDVEQASHHIAIPTSKEPVTTGNASSTLNIRNTEPLLSPDGRRVRDYWSQLGYESTSASNTHWNTLSKHIASYEQMDSLYEYARAKLKNADDPTVHPGNMVKAVNGWKQKQAPGLVAVGAQQSKPKTKKQAEEEWIASLKADPWK